MKATPSPNQAPPKKDNKTEKYLELIANLKQNSFKKVFPFLSNILHVYRLNMVKGVTKCQIKFSMPLSQKEADPYIAREPGAGTARKKDCMVIVTIVCRTETLNSHKVRHGLKDLLTATVKRVYQVRP